MVATQHSKHHQNSGWFKGFLVGGLMTIICVLLFNNVSNSSAPYSPALKYSTESGFIVGASKPQVTSSQALIMQPISMANLAKENSDSMKRDMPRRSTAAPQELPTTISSSSSSRMSRTQCSFKYGKREFLDEEHRRLPPMLYTFPGSGNTWCRLLIEYSTGVLTGAVYNDKTLLEALPGEFSCNWKVSAIKVHPHTHGFEGLRSGTFSSDDNKCKIGGVKKFERAILLIRDPFDSIWSEYQRRLTQSHVAGIPKKTFNWHRWQANAAALSHKYLEMWDVQHAGIERHFGNTPESFAQNILYVRYEDLKSSQRRVGALKTIVDFLRLSSKSQSAAELNERLECAFVLAENRQAHRHTDPALFMTKSEAYTRPLACRMWALFGKYAAEHKYGPWANYNCSAGDETNGGVPYPMIPKVNVGPRGEYNFKWVTQGAKKIDFGGYNASAYSPGDDALNKGPRKRTIHKKSHPSTAGGLKQRVNNAGAAGAISGTSSSNKPVANLRAVVVGESVSAPRPLIPVNIANGELESRKESELSVSTGMTLSKASKLTSSGSGVVGASAPAWQ